VVFLVWVSLRRRQDAVHNRPARVWELPNLAGAHENLRHGFPSGNTTSDMDVTS
jgi:hypothetical protein